MERCNANRAASALELLLAVEGMIMMIFFIFILLSQESDGGAIHRTDSLRN